MSAGCYVLFYIFNKNSDLLWCPSTSFSENGFNNSLARMGGGRREMRTRFWRRIVKAGDKLVDKGVNGLW